MKFERKLLRNEQHAIIGFCWQENLTKLNLLCDGDKCFM